jgi:DNA-binding transcriptional LysR family regulator
MDRDLLSHLPIVISVARHRGFAPAAANLGMSPSAVSHAVRTVEDRLGEPLFARTTRSVSLTEAGRRFLAGIAPALDDIDTTIEGLAADRGEVKGLLRINAPRVALQMAVTPILVDIVAEGFDAGIRLGASVQQDMIAMRLTKPFKAILVASQTYIEAKGAPKALADLQDHNCIGFRLIRSGGVYDWELKQGDRDISVKTSGTSIVTDATYARDLALAGIGIAYIFEPLVRRDIREGRLKWLMPQCAIEEDGLFLYYPRRASLAPKLRAFIDAMRSLGPGPKG